MNILLLSVGTRNQIVRYFKKAFAGVGNVVAADMSPLAPALYEADRFYIVPGMNDPTYVPVILDICKKEQIQGVLSLIDPELLILADQEEAFRQAGVTVIGSSPALCEMALDKYQMFLWLEAHGYLCAKSYLKPEDFFQAVDAGTMSYPVFVKPVKGSASLSISKVFDGKTVELLCANDSDLMIQEFLDGQEIGADVYIDMISGKVVSIFTKKKLKMRAGETDKAVSFRDPELFALIERFALEAGFRGQIDIDLFDVDGKFYISEVNPRFGGGYPHAYACGCDHMKLILNNLKGISNVPQIGAYEEGIYMMKYNEICIKKLSV